MTIKVEHVQASYFKIPGKEDSRIDTLLCEYPLDIHAQLLTHGVFSKNSSSCRAIPISKAISQLRDNPATKMWTAKNKGMQGPLITDMRKLGDLRILHNVFMEQAITAAETMDSHGVHKQNAGRYLTPFQNIKIVLTSTEWENWDWLRNDQDAQPEIRELAQQIYAARMDANPLELFSGEYHVPFVKRHRDVTGNLEYYTETEDEVIKICEKHAIDVSMSCCAQTSYRNLDSSLEKAEDIIPKLFGGKKIHASPAEHQAKVPPVGLLDFDAAIEEGINIKEIMGNLPDGITAIDTNLNFRSGNFINWIQQRQLIPGHDAAIKSSETTGIDLSDETISGIGDVIKALAESCKQEAKDTDTPSLTEVEEGLAEAFKGMIAGGTPSQKLIDLADRCAKDSGLPSFETFSNMSPEDQKTHMNDINSKIADKISKLAE